MYTLCRGLWHEYFTRLEYRFLIVGCDAAGKSLLLERLRHLLTQGASPLTYAHKNYSPTIGLNIARIAQLPAPHSHLSLLCWDVGGLKELRELWSNYYDDTHAILYVIDCTDKLKLSESMNELYRLMRDIKLQFSPFLVLLNKSDLQSLQSTIQLQLSEEFNKQQNKINQLNSTNNSPSTSINGNSNDKSLSHVVQVDQPLFRLQSISALTGDGLQSALDWLLVTLRDSDRTRLLADRDLK
jgi:ADP-ribosylation factor related protein 1